MVGGRQSEAELEPVKVSAGGNPAGRRGEAGGEAGSVLRLWEAAEILGQSTEGLGHGLVIDVREQCQTGGLVVSCSWYRSCGWSSSWCGLGGEERSLAPFEFGNDPAPAEVAQGGEGS